MSISSLPQQSVNFGSPAPFGRTRVLPVTTFNYSAQLVDERRKMQHGSRDLESIRRDIAVRLRPTCTNMSDEEFDKMVARMALIEWKHLNDATPTSQMQSH
jgi:hypothetical protein